MPQKSKTILTFAFYWLMIAIEKQKERGVNMNNQKMDERTKVIVNDAVEAAKGFIMLQTSEKEFILGFIKGMAAQKELSEAREKIA